MTVSTQVRVTAHAGDGETQVFSYAFKVLSAAELLVIMVDADGMETQLAQNTDYSVSGVGEESGGLVTYVTAPGNGTVLYHIGATDLSSNLDLSQAGPFPSAAIEAGFDKLTRITQELDDRLDRAPRMPYGETGLSLPRLADRSDKVLGFNADGSGFALGVSASLLESTLAAAANDFAVSAQSWLTNVAALALLDPPGSTTSIMVLGRTVPGDGGQGVFRWVAGDQSDLVTEDPYQFLYIPPEADGTGASGVWKRVPARSGIFHVDWGPVVKDGSTDNRDLIQAAVDLVLYGSDKDYSIVQFGTGFYACEGMLDLGYGDVFKTLVFRGIARADRQGVDGLGAVTNPVGTRLVHTGGLGEYLINVQGGRDIVIEEMALVGKLAAGIDGLWDAKTAIEAGGGVANWAALGGDSGTAPYVAIAVDARSPAKPTEAYGDLDYPPFTGVTGQYEKRDSSTCVIRNVDITGFNTGIALKPSGDTDNADFTQIYSTQITRCLYGVSVGHQNSRNVHIQGMTCDRVRFILTNNSHGEKRGIFAGTIEDLSLSRCGEVFKFGKLDEAAPITFINFYCENTWRIGSADQSTTPEKAVRFINGVFRLSYQSPDEFGPAAWSLDNEGNGEVLFDGCEFDSYPEVLALKGARLINRCTTRPVDSASTVSPAPKAYRRYAHNATCGGIVLDPDKMGPQSMSFRAWDRVSGTDGGTMAVSDAQTRKEDYTRNRGLPLYADTFVPSAESYGRRAANQIVYRAEPKGSFDTVTLLNGVLTLEETGLTEALAASQAKLPGDIIVDENSGTIFFIRSTDLTGTPAIVAEQMNNYSENTTYTVYEAISTATGNLWFYCGRAFALSRHTKGDVSSSSAVITNVSRPTGSASHLSSDIAVGDYMVSDDRNGYPFSINNAKVSGRSTGSKTITMGGNGVHDEGGRDLTGVWMTTGPANETSR